MLSHFFLMVAINPLTSPFNVLTNVWFSGIFRRYKMGTLTRNGLNKFHILIYRLYFSITNISFFPSCINQKIHLDTRGKMNVRKTFNLCTVSRRIIVNSYFKYAKFLKFWRSVIFVKKDCCHRFMEVSIWNKYKFLRAPFCKTSSHSEYFSYRSKSIDLL